MNILDVLLPHFCVGCGRIGVLLCKECSLTIEHIMPYEYICPQCKLPAIEGFTHPVCLKKYTMDGLISFFHYRGVVRKAIKEIKYRFIESLVYTLLQQRKPYHELQIRQFIQNNSSIIPIPLHPKRLKLRGFNQAETLSTALATLFSLDQKKNVLIRIINTQSQTLLIDKKERFHNMKHVFSLNHNVVSETVLLVDDVFTTGATMHEATRVLKSAGVKRVYGVTIAR